MTGPAPAGSIPEKIRLGATLILPGADGSSGIGQDAEQKTLAIIQVSSVYSSSLGIAIILAGSADPASSSAQRQDGPAIELAPVIVTGEVYAFGAQKLTRVSDKELDRLQARDLTDVFTLAPSIQVGGGVSVAEKIYVRGNEDKMLHVSIDGATQAGYLSHHKGEYTIEPELLMYAEAEPGPGEAAVGPGALAGAVRSKNKGASDFLDSEHSFGAFAKASYGSNAKQVKLTGAGYGHVSERISVLFAYTHSDSDDYVDGKGDAVEYTAHSSNRAFLKLNALIDARQSLDFSHEDLSNEGAFRHRPNFYGFFYHPLAPNKPVKMDFERSTAMLGYRFQGSEDRLDLKANLYSTDNSIDRVGQYRLGYESLGLDLSNASRIGDHTIVYGLNYRDDTAYFTGKGQTQGFLPVPLVYKTIPDERIETAGLFLQDEWEAAKRLQVTYGARIDRYAYEDKDGQAFADSGFSPNIGLSFAATDRLDINASYGAAFRGVTPIDLITANEGGVTNHPGIDGEWARNLELGLQYDTGICFANGTIYQQEIDDVIVSSGTRDNDGKLEVRGYDFTFAFRQRQLSSSLGMSYSNPELNGDPLVDTDFGIGSSYGRSWISNTTYSFVDLRLDLGWILKIVERYDEAPIPSARKPSYAAHNFYLQWRAGENDTIAVTLAIDNAFDKYYVDQATSGYNSQLQRIAGLPAPGRNVRLSTSIGL